MDEVGYAPLAGPVVAAAVILPAGPKPRLLRGLTDSKLLSAEAREYYFGLVNRIGIVAVGAASVEEIDSLNIYHANLLAMARAVEALGEVPDAALVDGRASPPLACRVRAVVKGDRRSLSIAAASVVAKVTRDRMMKDLARAFPGYGWETNVGYGTEAHYLGLLRHGPSIHHRHSFAPLTTVFASGGHGVSRFRFEPIRAMPDPAGIELLELRRDLHAVFDSDARHVGQVNNLRGRWTFQSVGYSRKGDPLHAAGPFADCHGQQLDAPDVRLVMRLLARQPGNPVSAPVSAPANESEIS
ncbi:MAG: ribonuclease HII [Gammaproteobacteria bacterium]